LTGHIGRWHGWRALIVVALLFANGAEADAREDYLVRLLRTSEAFRVRAQAALSLGQLESTRSSISALERALADAHPAVRVAAISSLRRLEAKQSLPVVEQATRDRDKAVRRAAKEAVEALQSVGQRPHGPGPTRYLVAMGMPGTKAERVSRQMLFDARIFLAEQLQQLEGVECARRGRGAHAGGIIAALCSPQQLPYLLQCEGTPAVGAYRTPLPERVAE
jgi:hypothetical protein